MTWATILSIIAFILKLFTGKSPEERTDAKFEKKLNKWEQQYGMVEQELAAKNVQLAKLLGGSATGHFTSLQASCERLARLLKEHPRPQRPGPDIPR